MPGVEAGVQRARSLFEFLAEAQRLRTRPVHVLDAYRRDGAVIWLAELPQHPGV